MMAFFLTQLHHATQSLLQSDRMECELIISLELSHFHQ